MASKRYGTLYIGVTSDLIQRIWQHRSNAVEGFTQLHHIKQLVWYEIHCDIREAIQREKQLKKWNRAWKIKLISSFSPTWRDLYSDIIG